VWQITIVPSTSVRPVTRIDARKPAAVVAPESWDNTLSFFINGVAVCTPLVPTVRSAAVHSKLLVGR
jgi:hypothetical protein